jgi:Ca2+-binding EF-hand superfamily protein
MFTQLAVSPWNNWNLNNYSQMTGLSQFQLQQLQSAFNQQAASTGGRLPINQFQNIYSGINGLSWNFDNEAQRAFPLFGNNSNNLTLDEFLMGNLMLQRGVNPVQRWSYAVNSYPLSRPGYLSQQEAQLLLNNMQSFYNFPMQESYFTTAWSQFGGNEYVPASSFVEAVIPLIPQTYIW